MRNLKRALSLLLATVMVIGMMVTGASAASYNDFVDEKEIVNKDAVSMLTTLGIMEGVGNNEFAPEVTFTREQMAALVSRIMNKGADNNDLYLGADFGILDLAEAGSWAQGHINYCYSTGIISGDGLGHFFPKTEVKAVEAAKMLLTALGYDAQIEGLVGEQWAIKTSALASKLGIFDGYTGKINDVLTRDNAALLIYNALDVEMIETYDNKYPMAFKDARTILSAMYGVVKVEGVVMANEYASLMSDKGETSLREGLTYVYNEKGLGTYSTTGSTSTSTDSQLAATKGSYFNVSTPVDMLGKTVTLYIKKNTILANSEVYGDPVVSDINEVVVTGNYVSDKVADKNESYFLDAVLADNNLSADDDTEYYWNFAAGSYIDDPADYTSAYPVTTTAAKDAGWQNVINEKGATLTIIDNNSDGVVDYLLSVEKSVTTVSKYNAKTDELSLKGVAGTFKGSDGEFAKDDVVEYVTYGGATYIEAPEYITGTMELYNVRVATNQYIKVDGETYHADNLYVQPSATNLDKFFVVNCEDDDSTAAPSVMFKTTYEFYMDDFGNIVAFREVEGSAPQYGLVLDSAWSTNSLETKGMVEVLTADGVTKTYTLDFTASANNFADSYLNTLYNAKVTGKVETLKAYLGNYDYDTNGANKYGQGGVAAGRLVKYTIDEDGLMTIAPAKLLSNTYSAGALTGAIDEIVNGNDTTYLGGAITDNKFFQNGRYSLAQDLSKGDVDLYITNGTTPMDLGIDDDTVVFYYDGTNASVVTGYDAMANKILMTGGTGTIDDYWVGVSVVGKKNATDIVDVMVVYTSQAKFNKDNYVYVMPTFDVNTDGYIYYDLITSDGTVLPHVKSKQDLTNDGIDRNGIGTDAQYAAGEVYTYFVNAKGNAVFEAPDWNTIAKGIVKYDGRLYANIYDTDEYEDDLHTADPTHNVLDRCWVEDANGDGSDDSLTAAFETWMGQQQFADGTYTRVANKDDDLIYDTAATTRNDETAEPAVLDNGQEAIVVYDDDKVIVAAFVFNHFEANGTFAPTTPETPDGVSKVTYNENTGVVTIEYSGAQPTRAQIRDIITAELMKNDPDVENADTIITLATKSWTASLNLANGGTDGVSGTYVLVNTDIDGALNNITVTQASSTYYTDGNRVHFDYPNDGTPTAWTVVQTDLYNFANELHDNFGAKKIVFDNVTFLWDTAANKWENSSNVELSAAMLAYYTAHTPGNLTMTVDGADMIFTCTIH